jgi:type III pantothenate kinase
MHMPSRNLDQEEQNVSNRIAVNMGNSRISWGLFVDDKLQELKHSLVGNAEAAAQAILDTAGATRTSRIAVCSVVPSLNKTMIERFRAEETIECLQITSDNQKLISNTYPSLGIDRIANVAAAVNLYVRSNVAIVLDMGTATTLTAADSSGKFLGGMITLGLGKTFHALYDAAEQLPDLTLSLDPQPPDPLALNTKQAIISGCILGHLGLLEQWVKSVRNQLESKCTIIATGGFASFLAPYTTLFDHVHPELTIHGINLIAASASDNK